MLIEDKTEREGFLNGDERLSFVFLLNVPYKLNSSVLVWSLDKVFIF